jgi:hypothetical protein
MVEVVPCWVLDHSCAGLRVCTFIAGLHLLWRLYGGFMVGHGGFMAAVPSVVVQPALVQAARYENWILRNEPTLVT